MWGFFPPHLEYIVGFPLLRSLMTTSAQASTFVSNTKEKKLLNYLWQKTDSSGLLVLFAWLWCAFLFCFFNLPLILGWMDSLPYTHSWKEEFSVRLHTQTHKNHATSSYHLVLYVCFYAQTVVAASTCQIMVVRCILHFVFYSQNYFWNEKCSACKLFSLQNIKYMVNNAVCLLMISVVLPGDCTVKYGVFVCACILLPKSQFIYTCI